MALHSIEYVNYSYWLPSPLMVSHWMIIDDCFPFFPVNYIAFDWVLFGLFILTPFFALNIIEGNKDSKTDNSVFENPPLTYSIQWYLKDKNWKASSFLKLFRLQFITFNFFAIFFVHILNETNVYKSLLVSQVYKLSFLHAIELMFVRELTYFSMRKQMNW